MRLPQPLVIEVEIDPNHNRLGLLPALDRNRSVTGSRQHLGKIFRADHQDRNWAHPASDFTTYQVERREDLVGLCRDPELGEPLAEEIGARPRAIRREDDPQSSGAKIGDQFGGAGKKRRSFPDRAVEIECKPTKIAQQPGGRACLTLLHPFCLHPRQAT